MENLIQKNNPVIKPLIWIGKILFTLILVFFSLGIFIAQDIEGRLTLLGIIIFILLPTIYIFFLKNKLPQLQKFWKIYRYIYFILIILYIALYTTGFVRMIQANKTQETIDFINSKKITMDDVMGTNLPPVPDRKLNDSTIAGIDANNNYIRDDVELAIFEKYPNSAKIRAAQLQYAQALQLELTKVYSSETLIPVIQKGDKAFNCFGYSLQDTSFYAAQEKASEIESIILNTKSREDKQLAIEKKYMATYSLSNSQSCDIDPSLLQN